MFVLRTAREVTASKTGISPEEVMLETKIDDCAAEVLSELYEQVIELLEKEQIIDSSTDAEELRPCLDAVEPGAEGYDVAMVADLVTRSAVDLLISTRLDVKPTELRPELSFAVDLGADSLTRVDLVLLLEETLEVSVPDDSMFLVQTVGDAQLFSVLFDRTREGVVLALGEPARDLTFDTPLERYGETASEVAREAAARAVGANISLPDSNCQTLKDAVRMAFLTEKLRGAFARAAGVQSAEIQDRTVPETDLGLSKERIQQILDELTSSMDFGPAPLKNGHAVPFVETVRALATIQSDGPGGATR